MAAVKDIETLVDDIYTMFKTGKDFTPGDTAELASRLARAITKKFKIRKGPARKDKIRPSNMGQPDRLLYFNVKADPVEDKFAPEQLLNFLYGDICEELMLWLAEQSGHKVTHTQHPVNGYGLRGYMDCKIDDKNVDAKSAFAANFKKFKDGSIKAPGKDPYGYIAQLSYYEQVQEGRENADTAYFFAFNKIGSLALTAVNPMEQINAEARVKHLTEMLKKDEPPEELCYEPEPDGKAGNMKLGTHCSRCDHKRKCHPDLRTFAYKPWRYLTHVEKLPKVEEVLPITNVTPI
jgi:hypothetical protein